MPYKNREDYNRYKREYWKKQKQTRKRNQELAYWAGFFDGEGSIGINQNPPRAPRAKSVRHRLALQIGNVDKAILVKFQKFFQVGSISRRKAQSSNHNISYNFMALDWDALKIIKELLPLLRLKKTQAKLAISYMQCKTPCRGYPHHYTPKKELELREEFWRLMKMKNRRGP